jgi:hypothetical protein
MTDEEVLDKAIELLRAGWTRGTTRRVERGRWPWQKRYLYCATGAVTAAVAGGDLCDYHQDERITNLLDAKVLEANSQLGKAVAKSIASYNDLFAENVEDVIKIFEKVKADL